MSRVGVTHATTVEGMVVVAVVCAVVAVLAIAAVIVIRSKLATERHRATTAIDTNERVSGELAAVRDELRVATESHSAAEALQATTSEELAEVRAALDEATRRADDAERHAGELAERGLAPSTIWPLELRRSARTWRFSVSPGPHAESPIVTDGPYRTDSATLLAALKVEVDAARNDVGSDVDLAGDLPDLDEATAVLMLRVAQELLADTVGRSDRATLRVGVTGNDVDITIEAIDHDGEPVSPGRLPVESPQLEPLDNGVRLRGVVGTHADESDAEAGGDTVGDDKSGDDKSDDNEPGDHVDDQPDDDE